MQTCLLHTIAPHWSLSYPEYLSPTWDESTQRAVVWMRLQEHCKLANCSLAKVNERFHALCQEQQETQVKSSHKPLSHYTRLCCKPSISEGGAFKDCQALTSVPLYLSIMDQIRNGTHESTPLIYHGVGGLVEVTWHKTEHVRQL